MRRFLARHKEFVGNVAIMMSGRTLAAAIALFTMPIVARLFAPSDFGVAAIFASICGIVSSVATLHYGTAILLPEKKSDALKVMAFTFRVLFSFCVAMLILVGAYEISGATWSSMESLGTWKWYLPLGVLLMSSVEIQNSWLVRISAFNTASAALVTGNAVTTATRIGFGAFGGSSVFGLIVGYLVGLAARIAIQQTKSFQGLRGAFRYLGWSEMRAIALRYSDFPKLNAPASLLFSIGSYLPVLLFGAMFSPLIAGFYAMADRLSRVPASIVAMSARQVFMPRAVRIHQGGRSLKKAFLLSTGGLALLGTLPCVILFTYGQQLLTWLLGERWFEAGAYLEIMAPWLFVLWISAPCHPVFIVLEKQRYMFVLEVALTVARLGAFGLAYVQGAGPLWALKAFVGVTVAGNFVVILAVLLLILRTSPPIPNSDREVE